MNSENKKKVSLVLGSGGARGLAHIGVIRWLEEHGYQIASISGCSMGALPPDKVIVIPKNRCKMLEFHRADELIEFGYQQAERTLA